MNAGAMNAGSTTAGPMTAAPTRGQVLVTGATGYIGSRLIPLLLEKGWSVRALARAPQKLARQPWFDDPRVEVIPGDLSNPEQLDEALDGCFAAYYLVHSMISAGGDYAVRDRRLAENFVRAAERTKLQRIIYLGGLGELGESLSQHLASRREVEAILGSTDIPLTAFRAAMIIGSGSASFEILRYLVEHLPVMLTPKWVATECQPIGVANVLNYLVDCLSVPETAGRDLDIGCPDVLTYKELMQEMAAARGLSRRVVIPVPVLTPKLSSLWIHLVTPIGHRIARPLAEGLRNRVVCRDDDARRLMPQKLYSVREAIERAVQRTEQGNLVSTWSSSGRVPGDPDWAGGTLFVDRRETEIDARPEQVFRAVCRIGGGNGWYAADWLWRVRGWMDRLVGGPGLRRGRRDPETVAYGEALDFWRVAGIEPGRRLVLRAEMKLPGEAELTFELTPTERGTRLEQTARFQPKGLFGLAYWYSVLPLHHVVFRGMMNGIRRCAETMESGGPGGGTLVDPVAPNAETTEANSLQPLQGRH